MAAVAGPAALAVLTVVMLGAAAVGRHPFWTPEQFNMAEAAAARDIATVAAMLERGEDPAVPRPVRPPLLDGINRSVTPLEAGVIARRGEVVELLIGRGVRPSAAERSRLVCDALHNGDRDIAGLLAGDLEGIECTP
jgi:hypothetical protein